jgi:beta-lactamase regulating signal transducer with metallopeptidase domain
MRLDSANRTFLAFLLLSSLLGAYLICGVVAGVLVPILITHLSRDGLDAVGDLSLVPVLVLLAIIAVGVARASRILARQILASHRLASRIRPLAVTQPARLLALGDAAGLGGGVVLVGEPGRFSFVHGVLHPRVVVSQGLLERLSDPELKAVLEHERYHVANLDPLKTVTMQALTAAFFFVPALKSLHARYMAERELAADRQAIAACGTRALAGALLQAIRGPDWSETDVAVPLVNQTLLSARVAQLETGTGTGTGTAPGPGSFTIARATLPSLAAIALLTAVLLAAAGCAGTWPLHHATLLAIARASLLKGIVCAAPFAGAGLLLCVALAIRQKRQLVNMGAHRPGGVQTRPSR